jgi:hypothetical protein
VQCRSVGPPPLEAVASATKSYLVITKKDFSYVQLWTPHCPLIEVTLRVAAQKSVCPFPGASEESVQRPRTQAGLARFLQKRYSQTERCAGTALGAVSAHCVVKLAPLYSYSEPLKDPCARPLRKLNPEH